MTLPALLYLEPEMFVETTWSNGVFVRGGGGGETSIRCKNTTGKAFGNRAVKIAATYVTPSPFGCDPKRSEGRCSKNDHSGAPIEIANRVIPSLPRCSGHVCRLASILCGKTSCVCLCFSWRALVSALWFLRVLCFLFFLPSLSFPLSPPGLLCSYVRLLLLCFVFLLHFVFVVNIKVT